MIRTKAQLFGGALLGAGVFVQSTSAQVIDIDGPYVNNTLSYEVTDAYASTLLSGYESAYRNELSRIFAYGTSAYGAAYVSASVTENGLQLLCGTASSYQYHTHTLRGFRLATDAAADLLVSWDLTEFGVFGPSNVSIRIVEINAALRNVDRLFLEQVTTFPESEAFPTIAGSVRVPINPGRLFDVIITVDLNDTEPSNSPTNITSVSLGVQVVEPLPDDSGLPITSEQIADLDRDGDADLDDILLYFAAFADFSTQP